MAAGRTHMTGFPQLEIIGMQPVHRSQGRRKHCLLMGGILRRHSSAVPPAGLLLEALTCHWVNEVPRTQISCSTVGDDRHFLKVGHDDVGLL